MLLKILFAYLAVISVISIIVCIWDKKLNKFFMVILLFWEDTSLL